MMSNTKRISKKTKLFRSRIIYSRNILLVVVVSIMIFFGLLYLSSTATKIEVQTGYMRLDDSTITNEDINDTFSNVTITEHSFIDNNWYIDSIDLYLSSVADYVSLNDMRNYVIYNKPITSTFMPNTLKFEIYKNKDCYTGLWSINYIDNFIDCPNEFVLSYLKIRITVMIEAQPTNIDYYYFFQEDYNIATKTNVVTYLYLKRLTFNSTYYEQWYAWKSGLNQTIPQNYPYGISLTLMNYVIIENPMDTNQFWRVGW